MRSETQSYCNSVVSPCACDFSPKFWNDKMNFTRVFVKSHHEGPGTEVDAEFIVNRISGCIIFRIQLAIPRIPNNDNVL